MVSKRRAAILAYPRNFDIAEIEAIFGVAWRALALLTDDVGISDCGYRAVRSPSPAELNRRGSGCATAPADHEQLVLESARNENHDGFARTASW